MTLTVKGLLKLFMKKNCRRLIKNSLKQKEYKRKGNRLYVKFKGHDNLFSSSIDKKDIV